MSRPPLSRDRALLTLMLFRQAVSLLAIGAVLFLAFQLPDRRFAYIFAPFAAVFYAITIGMSVSWIGKYRARARAARPGGSA